MKRKYMSDRRTDRKVFTQTADSIHNKNASILSPMRGGFRL